MQPFMGKQFGTYQVDEAMTEVEVVVVVYVVRVG
jgi:hypothetical protein